MTNPQRAALLAAMYDSDDDQPDSPPIEPRSDSRTRKVRVGIIEYELPSIEYVMRLEQVVARQQATLDRQQRMINRMQVALANLRRVVNGQSKAMHEVYEELDTKLGIHG